MDRLQAAAASLAAVAVVAVLVTGCGGGNDSDTVAVPSSPSGAPQPPTTEQPLSAAEQHGRELFVQHCGSCHTLDAAGTVGQIGPVLDNIAINEQDVLAAIKTGGGTHSRASGGRTGSMPANLVTGQDAKDVAAFVAANASGSSTP
jgi:mono/diheme cytochrome c family protein